MENLAGTMLLALRFLMALALYGFLGWGLLVLWRDLKQQSEILTKQRVPPLQVSLREGAGSERLRFTVPEITIGRHPGCEWVLTHDTVSSRHARMVYHHDQWWLEDLDSRNGTFLNEEGVFAPVVLASGDAIRCGQVAFVIRFEETKIGGRNG
jgi:pSer/pThr/pTyr-binding forkhead associated (FHA) protein